MLRGTFGGICEIGNSQLMSELLDFPMKSNQPLEKALFFKTNNKSFSFLKMFLVKYFCKTIFYSIQ